MLRNVFTLPVKIIWSKFSFYVFMIEICEGAKKCVIEIIFKHKKAKHILKIDWQIINFWNFVTNHSRDGHNSGKHILEAVNWN